MLSENRYCIEGFLWPTSARIIKKGLCVVQSGNSLWKIAKNLLGDGARWTEIAALNKIENTIIRPGEVLKIPE